MNVTLIRPSIPLKTAFKKTHRIAFGSNHPISTLQNVKQALEEWSTSNAIDLKVSINPTPENTSQGRLSVQANVPREDNLKGILRQINLFFREAGTPNDQLFQFDLNGKSAEETLKNISSPKFDPPLNRLLYLWYIAEDLGA